MFSPDSNLRLLNVRFDSELRSTLWFPDRDTQTSWFLSQSDNVVFNDITYVKKDNAIVLGCREEDVWRFNYVMYQNSNFSSKWFYAFIVKREWASDYSVKFYLQTDPIQTWMFDWSLMTSYIERQHSATDSVGDNIIPEPIGKSQTIYQFAGSVDCDPTWISIFATSTASGTPMTGVAIGGMYSGSANVYNDTVLPNNFLSGYVENGTASAISRIQQHTAFGSEQGKTYHEVTYPVHPNDLAGYVPRNKKLLSSAFVNGYVTGFGQEIKFTPDFCSDDVVNLRFAQDITSGSVYCYVSNYGKRGSTGSTNVLGFMFNYPESTWAYNQYKNDYNLHNGSNSMYKERANTQWTANRNSAIHDTAATVISGIGNATEAGQKALTLKFGEAIGAGADAISDISTLNQNISSLLSYAFGYDEISQSLAYIDESYNAPAVGGVATSNPFIAAAQTDVQYGWIVPDARFAERYDQFLDVYGYAQNTYSIPNLHARKSWTYVKVSELMLDGNCPDEDELRIKAAFRNGIFFWVYDREYGNFNQDNGVL